MRLIWTILLIWATVLTYGVTLLFDNAAVQRATAAEISYIRQQQEANDRTIQYLIDAHWDLQERIKQVRREAWR